MTVLRDITPEGRALLEAITTGESDGSYNQIVGSGGRFTDYSKHPGIVGYRYADGRVSTAAGKYQITQTTWQRLKAKYGFGDFSPESQDKAAWYLAQEDFRRVTGQDLQKTLAAGNIPLVQQGLNGTWTSIKGGSQENAGTGKFAVRFASMLGKVTSFLPGNLTGQIQQITSNAGFGSVSPTLSKNMDNAIDNALTIPDWAKPYVIGGLGGILLLAGAYIKGGK